MVMANVSVLVKRNIGQEFGCFAVIVFFFGWQYWKEIWETCVGY